MVTLNQKSFKALASPTRLDLLKHLKNRPATLTELSEHIGKSKPATKEHLTELMHAGLIHLESAERKWKYYSLSNSGASLFNDSKNITLEFIFATVGAVGVIVSLLQYLPKTIEAPIETTAHYAMESGPAADMMARVAVESTPVAQTSPWPAVIASLFALVFILALLKMRR